jgi:hypothetical protein
MAPNQTIDNYNFGETNEAVLVAHELLSLRAVSTGCSYLKTDRTQRMYASVATR